ncbi:MAG: ankyrin repeat domain-containing protein [Alphaproteobacteria bacterium]
MKDRGIARWLSTTIIAALATIAPASAGPVENRALVNAAFELNIEAISDALSRGANPNSPSTDVFADPTPVTPISAVAMTSSNLKRGEAEQRALSIANLLFKHGAKIGLHDFGILSHPVSRGQRNFVALLLDKGASPTHRSNGYTPTQQAVRQDEKAIYDLLIAHGGKAVNKRDAAQIALVYAVWVMDDYLKMQKAIKDGAGINNPDVSGTTPLFSALDIPVYDAHHAASVRWLIENGADVNMGGQEPVFGKINPLHLFISRNSRSMNGDDENARRYAKQTMRLILGAGAQVSGMDAKDMTPLHWSAKADNLQAAEILIEAGSSISPRDKMGKQPLDYAESAAMIKLLKDHGAIE